MHGTNDLPHNSLYLEWLNLQASISGLHSRAKNIRAQTVSLTACFFGTGKEQEHAAVTSSKERDCDCVLYMWWFLTAYVDCNVSAWKLKHGSRRCDYVLAIFNYTVHKGEQMREHCEITLQWHWISMTIYGINMKVGVDSYSRLAA